MRKFAETCEAIASTTKKLLKTGIVAEYLKSRTVEEASVSAVISFGQAVPGLGGGDFAGGREAFVAGGKRAFGQKRR